MNPSERDLQYYLAVFRRQRLRILGTAVALFVVAVLVALLIPPAFRSTATILIEEQEVPPDLVRSAISSYADQRIQTIKHQVMTRPNLLKIVEQYGLYEDFRRRSTTEEVLERLTDDIHLEVISAEVVDRRTHQPTKATIAITLSYDGETPSLGQKVANELTSLFLAENLKSRERHAQETTEFLKQESEDLAGRLAELEQRISDFKQEARGALPELMPVNMQIFNQVLREQSETEQRINALEERRSFLEGQLEQIKPNTPIITASGERILDAGERLKALRTQLASSAAYMSEEHPDVYKMRQEVAALEREGHAEDEGEEIRKRLTDEHAKLDALVEQYGSDHPDIVRSRGIVRSLEQQLVQALEKGPAAKPAIKPENPAYIQTQAQLSAVAGEIQALNQTNKELKRRAAEYEERLDRTPQLEPGYLVLTRDRDNTEKKYHDVRHRLLEAQVSQGLEEQHKGERFSLIDPPDFPERPEKPNRPAILFLGLVLAMAGGLGAGAASESLDRSVRSPDMLREITNVMPLAVIPYLMNEEDRAGIRRTKRIVRWGAVALVIGTLVLVHVLWMPLDVIWYAGMRKLGL